VLCARAEPFDFKIALVKHFQPKLHDAGSKVPVTCLRWWVVDAVAVERVPPSPLAAGRGCVVEEVVEFGPEFHFQALDRVLNRLLRSKSVS